MLHHIHKSNHWQLRNLTCLKVHCALLFIAIQLLKTMLVGHHDAIEIWSKRVKVQQ